MLEYEPEDKFDLSKFVKERNTGRLYFDEAEKKQKFLGDACGNGMYVHDDGFWRGNVGKGRE